MLKILKFSLAKSYTYSRIVKIKNQSFRKFHDNDNIEKLVKKELLQVDTRNMNETYEIINTVPTHVFTYGKKLGEDFGNTKELVISISGNPGLKAYYLPFLSTLHQELNELPV